MSVSVAAPDPPTNVKVTLRDNNVIKVACDKPENFYGRGQKLRAHLFKGNTLIKNKTTDRPHCQFEFTDLYYHTTYTVEVCITLFLTIKLLYAF